MKTAIAATPSITKGNSGNRLRRRRFFLRIIVVGPGTGMNEYVMLPEVQADKNLIGAKLSILDPRPTDLLAVCRVDAGAGPRRVLLTFVDVKS